MNSITRQTYCKTRSCIVQSCACSNVHSRSSSQTSPNKSLSSFSLPILLRASHSSSTRLKSTLWPTRISRQSCWRRLTRLAWGGFRRGVGRRRTMGFDRSKKGWRTSFPRSWGRSFPRSRAKCLLLSPNWRRNPRPVPPLRTPPPPPQPPLCVLRINDSTRPLPGSHLCSLESRLLANRPSQRTSSRCSRRLKLGSCGVASWLCRTARFLAALPRKS